MCYIGPGGMYPITKGVFDTRFIYGFPCKKVLYVLIFKEPSPGLQSPILNLDSQFKFFGLFQVTRQILFSLFIL